VGLGQLIASKGQRSWREGLYKFFIIRQVHENSTLEGSWKKEQIFKRIDRILEGARQSGPLRLVTKVFSQRPGDLDHMSLLAQLTIVHLGIGTPTLNP